MSTLDLRMPLASSGALLVAGVTQSPPAVTSVVLVFIAVLTAALTTRSRHTTYVVIADPWVRVKVVAGAFLVGMALTFVMLALLRH